MVKNTNRLKELEVMNDTIFVLKNLLHGITKIDGMGTFDEMFKRLLPVVEHGFKRLR